MQTTNMTSLYSKAVLTALATILLSACAERQPDAVSDWAVNVGGPAYTGADGTVYLADESISGGDIGQLRFVPTLLPNGQFAVILDANSGEFVDTLMLDPWVK